MKNLILISLLISTSTFAQEKYLKKSDTISGLTVKHYDLNGDDEIDRIESWDGDRLVKLQTDKKFSGKINEWTQYFKYKDDVTPVEIVETDSNNDGKADRKNTVYRNEKDKLWVTTNEIDSDFDNVFEKKFNSTSALVQKDDCNYAGFNFENKFLKLANQSQQASSQLIDGEYLKTNFGYKINKGCMENWGKDFPNMIKTSISQGMKCLEKLAKDNDQKKVKPNGALSNLKNLDQLINSQGVTLVCTQKKKGDGKDDYDWEGAAAHASTGPTDGIKEFGIKHPYLSFSPNNPKVKGKGTKEEKAFLQRTIFHEQLHNLGIKHGEGVEAPYTCESCCFPGDSKEASEAACKICGGGYTSSTDKNYIKDMVAWGKATYDSKRATMAVDNYMKEFPKDKFGLLAYADITADSFSPVGYDIAAIIKKRFNNLTDDENTKIDEMLTMRKYSDFKNPFINKVSPVLAQSYLSSNLDKNDAKAVEFLKKEKATFKAMLESIPKAKGNDTYKLENLKEHLSKQLKAIWMKDYPKKGAPESDEAYKLLTELKLI